MLLQNAILEPAAKSVTQLSCCAGAPLSFYPRPALPRRLTTRSGRQLLLYALCSLQAYLLNILPGNN